MSGADLDLVVRARRAVMGVYGTLRPCSVGVRSGRIVAVEDYEAALDGAEVIDLAADEVLLPGLVDSHVHVNEPGRADWEGFATATAAAAAGGVTTIIDMPLNSIPPTCDVAALEVKRTSAEGRCQVDVGFWGGAIPGNAADLRPLHEAGVFGFKCFLLPSGVDEFAPEASFVMDAAALRHRNAVSAYHGKRLTGLVRRTWLRGRPADGEPTGRLLRRDEPAGRLLRRDEPAGRLLGRRES